MAMNSEQSNADQSQSIADHSVTQYIDGLRNGDELAAQKTWERFIDRLIRLAENKLRGKPGRAADEEDVVQQAFAQFFLQVQEGRFTKLNDRDDLWQVLCMLVDRRSVDFFRKENADVRGGGKVKGDSIWMEADKSQGPGINGVPDLMQPTPSMAKVVSEMLRIRLDQFENDEHRQVALLKLQCFTNEEIAEQMKSSVRTVERWLGKMRESWIMVGDDESSTAV